MTRIFTVIYGIVTGIALFLGLIAAIIFTAAIIAGQDLGNTLALLAGDIMNWGIVLAALAMIAGMVIIYATREHSLTMEAPKNAEDPKE